MTESPRSSDFFETLSRVLLRCWISGYALVFIWFGLYLLAPDFVYQTNGKLFGVTKHELDLTFFCGIGLLKLVVIMFFLVPWLAIRLVLRKPA